MPLYISLKHFHAAEWLKGSQKTGAKQAEENERGVGWDGADMKISMPVLPVQAPELYGTVLCRCVSSVPGGAACFSLGFSGREIGSSIPRLHTVNKRI